MMHRRIRLTVRYDGTEFAGSQIQPGVRTVAGTLKAGLESILGGGVELVFASRTDAGVHADGNVCAFDANPPFPAVRLPEVIAPRLPADLEVRDAVEVEPGFNPRYAARLRSYVYRIYRDGDVPVDRQRYVMSQTGGWDNEAVTEALKLLEGEHSFRSFSKGGRENDNGLCTLYDTQFVERGAEVELWFNGNRFLRSMICRLAGALIDVAGGKLTPQRIARALEGQMDFSTKPAPARGLTLVRIGF